MINIIIGLFLILIDITITVPRTNGIIDIFPSVLGYLFLLIGLRKYKKDAHGFSDIKIITLIMVLYSAIKAVTSYFGIYTGFEKTLIYNFEDTLTNIIVPLYITNRILLGVQDITEKSDINGHTDTLCVLFVYSLIINALYIIVRIDAVSVLLKIADLGVDLTVIFYLILTYSSLKTSKSID